MASILKVYRQLDKSFSPLKWTLAISPEFKLRADYAIN
jgi:hypothetical protein